MNQNVTDLSEEERSVPMAPPVPYVPFSSFHEWAGCAVDEARWNRYLHEFNDIRTADPALHAKALDELKRAAALETGAIEGLYRLERGITLAVTTGAVTWEAVLAKHRDAGAEHMRAQLRAYDLALDFATGQMPIAEAWIRDLHREICSAQRSYSVLTEVGTQSRELVGGEYKKEPNNPFRPDGSSHSYAPVMDVVPEMARLTAEIRSDPFERAHPIIQATYAHHSFVAIHPFPDGNGRVARALASVFTYRAASVPMLVLSESHDEYIAALEAADAGDRQNLVSFLLERTFDAFRMVRDSIRSARAGDAKEAAALVGNLYLTRGGFTHAQVDEAAHRLVQLASDALLEEIKRLNLPPTISPKVLTLHRNPFEVQGGPKFRWPVVEGPRGLQLRIETSAPAEAKQIISFSVAAPRDCGREDDLVIEAQPGKNPVEARLSEVLPKPSEALRMRLSMWARGTFAVVLADLHRSAEANLRGRGY